MHLQSVVEALSPLEASLLEFQAASTAIDRAAIVRLWSESEALLKLMLTLTLALTITLGLALTLTPSLILTLALTLIQALLKLMRDELAGPPFRAPARSLLRGARRSADRLHTLKPALAQLDALMPRVWSVNPNPSPSPNPNPSPSPNPNPNPHQGHLRHG